MRKPSDDIAPEISPDSFFAADIRLGTITRAEPFPEARKPAYRLWIDFGESVGEKRSSAQITGLYALEQLVGRRVLAVVNFPPRQIGPVRSEVLVLGVHDSSGNVVLLEIPADADVANGAGVS